MVLIFSSGSIELVVWSAAYEKFSSGLTPQFSTSIDVILSQNHVVWISSISKRSIDYKTCVISIPTVVQCSYNALIDLRICRPSLSPSLGSRYLFFRNVKYVSQLSISYTLFLLYNKVLWISHFNCRFILEFSPPISHLLKGIFFFSFAFFSIFVFIVTLS